MPKRGIAPARPSRPGAGSVDCCLLDPLPRRFGGRSRRRRRVSVLQLIRGERHDQPLLLGSDKIRKNISFDPCDQYPIALVDGVGAETGNKPRQDSFVFLGGALIDCLSREFGNVGPRDELREMAIRRRI